MKTRISEKKNNFLSQNSNLRSSDRCPGTSKDEVLCYTDQYCKGKVVDEVALIDALKEKKIAGAGPDVFEKEPLPIDSPLLKMDNVVLTPHIAFLSEESLDECTYMSIENIEMFIKGMSQNVANPEVLPS